MNAKIYDFDVEDCGADIQADAKENGYTHVRLIDAGTLSHDNAKLYAVPVEGGEVLVLDTNGGAVWQEFTNPDEWADTLEQYGINPDRV